MADFGRLAPAHFLAVPHVLVLQQWMAKTSSAIHVPLQEPLLALVQTLVAHDDLQIALVQTLVAHDEDRVEATQNGGLQIDVLLRGLQVVVRP